MKPAARPGTPQLCRVGNERRDNRQVFHGPD
jgi:hypothetical protein